MPIYHLSRLDFRHFYPQTTTLSHDCGILIPHIRVSFPFSPFLSLSLSSPSHLFPLTTFIKGRGSLFSPIALIGVFPREIIPLHLGELPVPDVAAFTAYNCRGDAARRPAQLFGDKYPRRRRNGRKVPNTSRRDISEMDNHAIRNSRSREWTSLGNNFFRID